MNHDEIRNRLVYQTPAEERFNSITHGAAALLSLIGLLVLIVATARGGDPVRMVSCTIFGATLFAFYIVSTIYHGLVDPRAKYLFRILDHSGIYLVIAGSYTPFTLVILDGAWGWSLFGIVWGLAVAGIVFKAFLTHRLRILGPILYIAMGWLMVVALEPLLAVLPVEGFHLLLAGGIAYTVGVGVYALDVIPFNHGIWHLFVMAGSLFHYLAVLWYVVPV